MLCLSGFEPYSRWVPLVSYFLCCPKKIGDFFTRANKRRRDRHFTWSSEPREGPAFCKAIAVTSFLSYFQDPEY